MAEGYWHKVKQLEAVGADPQDGFALGKLEEALLEGSRLATHYLRNYDEYRGKPPFGDSTPSTRRH